MIGEGVGFFGERGGDQEGGGEAEGMGAGELWVGVVRLVGWKGNVGGRRSGDSPTLCGGESGYRPTYRRRLFARNEEMGGDDGSGLRCWWGGTAPEARGVGRAIARHCARLGGKSGCRPTYGACRWGGTPPYSLLWALRRNKIERAMPLVARTPIHGLDCNVQKKGKKWCGNRSIMVKQKKEQSDVGSIHFPKKSCTLYWRQKFLDSLQSKLTNRKAYTMSTSSSDRRPTTYLDHVTITGAEVGIRSNHANIVTKNAKFENVATPFEINGGVANISGTRITESYEGHSNTRRGGSTTSSKNIPPMPAHCGDCESIFPSRRYTIFNAKFYGLHNAEICPLCGSPDARLADGIFEAVENVIYFLTGPSSSRDFLVFIQKLAKDRLAGNLSETALVAKVEAQRPGFATLWKRLTFFGGAAVIIYGLLADYDSAADKMNDISEYFKEIWYQTYPAIIADVDSRSTANSSSAVAKIPEIGAQ